MFSLGSRKFQFVINPMAGGGRAGRVWRLMRSEAARFFGPLREAYTASPGDATLLARDALLNGSDGIVCVGGDGTLNEVVNGFMDGGEPLRAGALLAYFPCGTGCDFVRTLRQSKDILQALKGVSPLGTKTIDLGRMVCRDRRGKPMSRYFHNITSFGLGGEVNNRVNRSRKRLGGFPSFLLATGVSLLLYRRKRIRLRVDDSFDGEVTSWNVAVANGQFHGGGMWVAPDARIDDGLLHVTVVGDFKLPEILFQMPRLYNGKIYGHRKILNLKGRRIEATSGETVLIDMDGEQPGRLPLSIDIVPRCISVLVSGETA